MATLNGIYYDEEPGSPTFGGGRDGPTAQRKLRVAWSDVDHFLSHIFPATIHTGKGWIFPISTTFPNRNWLAAQGYKVDPWDKDKTTGHDANGVRAYDWATITLDYKAPEYDPNKKDPAEEGDQILADYSSAYSAEMLKLGVAGWAWASDLSKIKNEDVNLAKVVGQIEHTLTWNYVPSPPFKTIAEYVGCVNSDYKLFYAPEGTLLFMGADIKRSYHSQSGDESWKVTYKFVQRCVKAKNTTESIGWNHIWRSEAAPGGLLWQGWDKPVQSNGAYLYESQAFYNLFRADNSSNTSA